jgi:hypothetical protein
MSKGETIETIEIIRQKYVLLKQVMNERLRRLWAAGEAKTIGWGGISQISIATGLSRTTITSALRELENLDKSETRIDNTIRRSGGGRKKIS